MATVHYVHGTLWPWHIVATVHYGHGTLWPRYIMAMAHYGHGTLWPRYIMATVYYVSPIRMFHHTTLSCVMGSNDYTTLRLGFIEASTATIQQVSSIQATHNDIWWSLWLFWSTLLNWELANVSKSFGSTKFSLGTIIPVWNIYIHIRLLQLVFMQATMKESWLTRRY